MTQKDFSPVVTWGVRIAGATAALIGSYWLAAWGGGWAAQWSAAGMITMKTNMALCLVLGGIALALGYSAVTRPRRTFGLLLGAVVLLVGTLTLGEHLLHADLGIDQFLATEAPGAVATASPNRIGPLGSINLVLLGAGLLALAWRRGALAPYLGLAVCMINLVPAVGFLYGAEELYDLPRLTSIAWPTVLALVLLGTGLMLVQTEDGPMTLFLRLDSGGMLLRRMVPAVILIPLVLGFIAEYGQYHALYDMAIGIGLFVVALILVFAIFLWRTAARLSHEATIARAAEEELHRSQEQYRHLVESSRSVILRSDANLNIIFMNRHGQEYFGYSADELIGRNLLGTIIPEKGGGGEDLAAMTLDLKRNPEHYETNVHQNRRKDGALVWMSWTNKAIYDSNGDLIEILAIGNDLTKLKEAEEAQRRSDAMLRAVLDQMPSGVTVRDARTGKLVLSNARSREILGALVDVVDEFPQYRGQHPDGRMYATEEWPGYRSLTTGEVVDAEEIRCERSDGTDLTLSIRSAPVRDSQGNIVLGVVTFHDITERKRVENALHESEERYRTLFENMTEGFALHEIITDDHGRPCDYQFLEVNPSFEQLTGLRREDLLGKRVLEVLPGQDRLRIEQYGNVAMTGKPIRFEDHATPSERWYEVLAYRPAPRQFAVIFTDITERKRAEEAQRASEEKYRTIVETAAEGIVITRPNGEFFYANQRMVDMLGCRMDEIMGKTGLDFTCDDQQTEVLELRKELHKGDVVQGELKFCRKDGSVVWSMFNATPIFNDRGEHISNLAMHTDVTRRKQIEQALHESQERFRLAIEHSELMAWQCDTDLRFTWVYNSQFGVPAGDLLGKKPPEVGNEETMGEFIAHSREVLAEGVGTRKTVKQMRADGKEQYFDQQIEPVRDSNGAITGLVGISLDVTERVLAEQRLHKSEESFRVMIAHSVEPMLLVDESGRIECISRRGAEQLGYHEAELVGTSVQRFLDWNGKLDLTLRLQDFVRHAPLPARAVLRIRKSDSEWCWMELQASYVNYGQKPEKYLLKFEMINLNGLRGITTE